MQKLIDETGNKYGLLTVLYKTKDKNGRTAWMCQCDCGNTKIVRGSDLRKKRITSCGRDCPLRFTRNNKTVDETGNHYGKLTVLGRSNPPSNNNGKAMWHCACECGNECDVAGVDLRSGKTVSCGCYSKQQNSDLQFKDETGNTYGYLTVISLVTKSPKAIWLCRCKCGNFKEVRGIDLRNGNVKSCGCLKSWYEEIIADLLNKHHISYSREYSFQDLKSDLNRRLRFDFAIFNNDNQLKGLIEYQGIQHTEPIALYGGKDYLNRLQTYDKRKQEYCKQNNIPLLILDKHSNIGEEMKQFITKVIGGVWDDD